VISLAVWCRSLRALVVLAVSFALAKTVEAALPQSLVETMGIYFKCRRIYNHRPVGWTSSAGTRFFHFFPRLLILISRKKIHGDRGLSKIFRNFIAYLVTMQWYQRWYAVPAAPNIKNSLTFAIDNLGQNCRGRHKCLTWYSILDNFWSIIKRKCDVKSVYFLAFVRFACLP
jgi:hypothetical protein